MEVAHVDKSISGKDSHVILAMKFSISYWVLYTEFLHLLLTKLCLILVQGWMSCVPKWWPCRNYWMVVHPNETLGEKTWLELYKSYTCLFEKILEAALHQTVAVQPLTSHLTNHPSKTNKAYLESNNKLINDVLLWPTTYRPTSLADKQGLTFINSERTLSTV